MRHIYSDILKSSFLNSLGRPESIWETKARDLLISCGYPDTDDYRKAVADALMQGGDLVSLQTGSTALEHGLPTPPPAFVRPGKLRIGDRVRVLNWVPVGTQAAYLDLGPKEGKIARMVYTKCRVTSSSVPYDRWPEKDIKTSEEVRLYALGLEQEDGTIIPLLTKDSSLVIRLDNPSSSEFGETRMIEEMI